MRDFGDIFKLGSGFFNSRGATLTMHDFLDDVRPMSIDFSEYENVKWTLIAIMGLKTSGEDQQKEAILSVLNFNHNIEAYIHEHLEHETVFYVVNKHFFDSWSNNVGFEESNLGKSAQLHIRKEEKVRIIDNASLIENMHSLRLKDIEYGVDFIILPRFVFFPLSKWHSCNKVIERKVIVYRQDRNKSLNLFKQKKTAGNSSSQANL